VQEKMNPKKVTITMLVTLFLASTVIVSINSTTMALATQALAESTQLNLSENETLPSTVPPTPSNLTIPLLILVNSTSEGDELEALSRVSHPEVFSTPKESSTYAAINPISSPPMMKDKPDLNTNLNVSELAVIPTPAPTPESSVLVPKAIVSGLESPQPALAPLGTAKIFLSEAICAVAIIVVTSTIVIALYVTRKNSLTSKKQLD
jgi:hypothetical protein